MASISKHYALVIFALALTFEMPFANAQQPGDLDTTFSSGTSANNAINVMDILPNEKIFIGGSFTSYNNATATRLALLHPDGTLDTTFSANTLLGANFAVRSVAAQPDGKILVGGLFTMLNGTSINRFTRLNGNGIIDTSFHTGTGPNNEVTFISTNGNRIVISGFFSSYNGSPALSFAVLLPNGTVDTSFAMPTPSTLTRCHYVLPNNKIYLGGTFTSYSGTPINRIARINADGTLDTSFAIGMGANGPVDAIDVQPDGKVLIAGSFTQVDGKPLGRVARLNQDGSVDSTFQTGLGASTTVRSILYQPNGKIIIGGQFTSYDGNSTPFIAQLHNNGDLDMCFDIGTGFNGSTTVTRIQSDGKILVAGQYTQYKGISANRLARLINDTCSGATKPTMSSNVYLYHCQDDSVFMQISSGELNDSPYWEWYKDSCSGTPIDTGWAIGALVSGTQYTFYVKGVNACECNCREIATVQVPDVLAPVPDLTSLPDLTAFCELQVTTIPTATDDCDGIIIGTTNDPLNYTVGGTYNIQWTFTDSATNTSTQNQTVIITGIDTSILLDTISPLTEFQLTANYSSPSATYQWLNCDSNFAPIPGQNNQTFYTQTTGNYAVVVSDSGCVDTSSCMSVTSHLSLPKYQTGLSLHIYPNPSMGELYIESTSDLGGLHLSIFDAGGKRCFSKQLNSGLRNHIQFGNIESGVYFMQIEGNGHREFIKLAILRP